MLINNVNGERVAASMVKNSEFYIEVAKFVQAYTTIVNNPNEFLKEVGLPLINEDSEMLNWNQFVKIMQTCDLGFQEKPTVNDLIIYYNYALEIGSLDKSTKRLASVDDVADAQKHYYNFVDEATDKAESEYLKQHSVTLSREREADIADNKLSLLRSANIVCFIFMMFAVLIGCFAVVSFFFDNVIVTFIGAPFKFWKAQYIGAIILLIVAVILFAIFDRLYVSTKDKYLDLKVATSMIFKRSDETYKEEEILKRKLNKLKNDLKIVHEEINDKNKTFDVKNNIQKLIATNKYYQRLCDYEEEFSGAKAYQSNLTDEQNALSDEEFAPVKLSKEQEENLHSVSREAINLEGVIDEEAFNEKFEKSTRAKSEEKEQNKEDDAQEKQAEQDEKQIKTQEEMRRKQEEFERKQQEELSKEQQEELLDSIDYIKDILGFGSGDEIAEREK